MQIVVGNFSSTLSVTPYMAKLLFRLKNVPEDEAAEVRALLVEHDIPFYETDPGNWGISMPALWINEESRWQEAKALIEAYQTERSKRVRDEYQDLKSKGQVPGFGNALRRNPVQFISYSLLIVAILYISISTFFGFS
ncbi:MAG: DUF6164 family protein [Pseudomonadales bacterium]|nr:DUF6164 family protein [Pseudomonadales bacterium]